MPKEKLQESVSELKSQLDEHGEVAAVDKQALGELAARLEVMLNGSWALLNIAWSDGESRPAL